MSHLPLNLYRLQFHAGFTFYHAIAILPYLKELGIDTIYCSPFFQAVKGSTHGYDIADPTVFNEELGGKEGFEAFEQHAHDLEMGIVLDLVANHMAASVENPWWYDILKHGKNSAYATYFDIDWSTPIKHLKGKVLVPILDLPSREAIVAGRITLVLNQQGLFISAMGQNLPLNPKSYSIVFPGWTGDADLNNGELLQKVREINQDIERMDMLLNEQHFHLEFWQYAPQNINYRRFFDINGLAALNMNDTRCFQQFHHLALKLFAQGKVQGMRIDHPDGFYEPYHYFTALREGCSGAHTPYIIIEKILEREESIPRKWPVEGSVGYEYLNLLNQLFIDESKERAFTELYEAFIEKKIDTDLMIQSEKREFALLYMTSEVNTMVDRLFCQSLQQQFTQEQLKEALVELYACFPVYRTYLEQKTLLLSSEEEAAFLEAFDRATLSKPHLDKSFEFLKEIFFNKRVLSESEVAFIMRFQQIAPSIMAKGFEDTHLYNYNRFISLNEVGGSPHHFGESIEYLHERMSEKKRNFPYGWITVSTHDTKRSHEMRLRLNVLSEVSTEWKDQVVQWKKEHVKYKHEGFPDTNREYFLYQTLVGWWPSTIKNQEEKQQLIERVKSYLIKASRESKTHTQWMHHHTAYEQALICFIEILLEEDAPFYHSLCAWVKKIDRAGQWNSLSCLNLMLGLPAALDIYQGTELWDFSFVDPDNRRKVDYNYRKEILEELKKVKSPDSWILNLVQQHHLEMLKPYMMQIGLTFRRAHKIEFLRSEYVPVNTGGSKKKHLIAYLRQGEQGLCTLTLSGRLLYHYRGKEFWEDTYIELPKGWKKKPCVEIYTQEKIQIPQKIKVQELLPLLPFGWFHCICS